MSTKRLVGATPQPTPTPASSRPDGGGGVGGDATLSSIERQIDAFDEKVRKFKAGYSTDTARLMFAELARLLAGSEPAAGSVARLRGLLVADRRLSASAAEPVRQYISWYLQSVDYAAELRRNFDKLIYAPLKSAIAAAAADSGGGDGDDEDDDDNVDRDEDAKEGERRRSREQAALQSLADEIPELRVMLPQQPPPLPPPVGVSDADAPAARLDRVRVAWSRLLGDGEHEDNRAAAQFDRRPLADAAGASAWLSAWTRLLPDVAAQCERASELSRRLLQDAIALRAAERSDTAAAAAVAAEKARLARRAFDALSERLRAAEKSAETAERQLLADGGDLEKLLEREERSAALGAAEHALAQESARLGDAAAALRRELADTLELLATAQRGSEFADKLAATARLRRRRLAALEQTLACVDYQRRVVREDLALEMSARPSIIQFTNHAQERCERLEQAVERANGDRARFELAIAAVERRQRRLLRSVASNGGV